MSTLTKEQIMKFANAWQAFILMLPWYMSTFGIDTLNRLLFGIALLCVFVILFLRKDNTPKVAVAIGTVDRFLKSQAETEKAKEVSEKDDASIIEDLYKLYHLFNELTSKIEPAAEPEPEPVLDPEVV